MRRTYSISRPILPILLLCALPLAAQEAHEGEDQERHEMGDPKEFTLLKDEGFPLNAAPRIIPAAEAELDDGDLVLGIVHNGEVRAYPVNYMNGPHNEVVNDELGGTAIASTW